MLSTTIKHTALLVAVATLGIFSIAPAEATRIKPDEFLGQQECLGVNAGVTLNNPCHITDGQITGVPDARKDTAVSFEDSHFSGILSAELNSIAAVAQVPEPASLLLLGTGLMAIGRHWRRRTPKA